MKLKKIIDRVNNIHGYFNALEVFFWVITCLGTHDAFLLFRGLHLPSLISKMNRKFKCINAGLAHQKRAAVILQEERI